MTILVLINLFVLTSSGISYAFRTDIISIRNNENATEMLVSKSTNVFCKDNNDCAIFNSECIQGSCRCRSQFIIDGTLTKCLKVATEYNDKCDESVQCSQFLSAGGICENGTCACKDGYHYLHGECHKTKGLNEPCDKNEECFVHTEYQATSCINGFCKCNDGYYQREYKTCRRAAKRLGDNCIIDSDCLFDNTTKCISQKCSLGNNEITYESVDNDGIFNVSYDIVIGNSCIKQTDCRSIANSHCGTDKKCTCNRAHFWSNDSKACIPEIGESCSSSDETYKVKYSICENQTWTCAYDRVNLKNNQNCRKIIKNISGNCQYREQCQLFGPQAECIDGQCLCIPMTHWLESERLCWLNKNIDETCQSENDCYSRGIGPRSFCKRDTKDKQGVCSCPVGAHPSTDKGYCISDKPEIGTYCEKNDDCELDHSFCDCKKCKCRQSYFELKGLCYAGLNATCTVDTDCKQSNTICSNKHVCRCKENFVLSPKDECVHTSSYEEKCKYDVQCTPVTSNTYCSFKTTLEQQSIKNVTKDKYGRCECIDNHFYNMNSCFKKKRLGEECTKKGECFVEKSASVCRNGRCTCDFDYIEEGNHCRQVNQTSTVYVHSSFVILAVIVFLLEILL